MWCRRRLRVLGLRVWAAILGFDAQLRVFWRDNGPVYEDLYPHAPAAGSVPSCKNCWRGGPYGWWWVLLWLWEAVKLLTGVGATMGEGWPIFGVKRRVGIYLL